MALQEDTYLNLQNLPTQQPCIQKSALSQSSSAIEGRKMLTRRNLVWSVTPSVRPYLRLCVPILRTDRALMRNRGSCTYDVRSGRVQTPQICAFSVNTRFGQWGMWSQIRKNCGHHMCMAPRKVHRLGGNNAPVQIPSYLASCPYMKLPKNNRGEKASDTE